MASSVSWLDESNPVLRLVTKAGKMGLPAVSRKKNSPKVIIINPLLTKVVWSRWLYIGVVFLRVYGIYFMVVHI